jgi:hypothetical protein
MTFQVQTPISKANLMLAALEAAPEPRSRHLCTTRTLERSPSHPPSSPTSSGSPSGTDSYLVRLTLGHRSPLMRAACSNPRVQPSFEIPISRSPRWPVRSEYGCRDS